jgi:hypothetical protein
MISAASCLLYNLLSLETDVNVLYLR